MNLSFEHLSLQIIIQAILIAAVNLPLPLLLLYSIFYFPIKEVIERSRYWKVKQYYEDITLLTTGQLQQFFPGKSEEKLLCILAGLEDRHQHKKYRADIRAEKKQASLKKSKTSTSSVTTKDILVPYTPSMIYPIILGNQI